MIWSVKHFRHYLYDHHHDIYTDHEALKSLLQTPHPSSKLARWGLAIQELDLNIIYCPGRNNSNVDALSRNPLSSVDQDPLSEDGVVAVLTSQVSSKSGERSLGERREATSRH